MEKQNVKSRKEKIIGIIGFIIELDRNKNWIFSRDLIVRYLFSSHLTYYVNEPTAEANELKMKVNKIK